MIQSNNKTLAALGRAARLTPDKPAFYIPGGASLTWAELEAAALSAACSISALGSDGDRPAVILADRSPASATAILGCMAAGVWYVPVDPELPDERLAQYLSVCEPFCVLAHGDGARRSVPGDIPVIDTDALPAAEDFTPADRPDSLPAFGIFTSGSTGAPKLVVKNRRSIELFIEAYIAEFNFTADEIFANQINFFFDASTKDIFSTVFLGATAMILPSSCFTFPLELMRVLNAERATAAVWVPSVLTYAARFGVLAAAKPETLRILLFVGEKMPVKYLNMWREALPGTEFVNLYGSTEVAGNSCFFRVRGCFEASDILPIGRPFDGTQVFLLDPASGLPADEGELCIAGEGLAVGYYKDPERTAEAFVQADLPGYSGRLYRSGDFGRRNEDGQLVCVSRHDGQIKYLGHRIELGDIETAAASLPYVSAACCFFSAEKEKIILCAAAPADCKLRLREDLAALLPDYMIPHRFRLMDEFPLNPNGKTDRVRLRELAGIG